MLNLLIPLVSLAAAAQAPQASAPVLKRPFQSLITAEDYPRQALQTREQGRVRFTLDVALNGRVARCVINASSGSSALDSATCRLLTSRARFIPARLPSGESVASVAKGALEWRLPVVETPKP